MKSKDIEIFLTILEKVKNDRYPSKNEILDALKSLGYSISERTFVRKLDNLRAIGLDVNYNKTKQGYYIERESVPLRSQVFNLFELISLNSKIEQQLGKEAIKKFVSFENVNRVKGIEYLSILIEAIEKNQTITLDYQSFVRDKKPARKVNPYYLKQYLTRWYLIGEIDHKASIRTFALDRIISIEKTYKTFTPKKNFYPDLLFEPIIGITYDDETILTDITLWADNFYSNYLESLPWHKSQKLVKEAENGKIYSLEIKPNIEFYQKVAAAGERIKILNPPEVVNEMKDFLKRALKNY